MVITLSFFIAAHIKTTVTEKVTTNKQAILTFKPFKVFNMFVPVFFWGTGAHIQILRIVSELP